MLWSDSDYISDAVGCMMHPCSISSQARNMDGKRDGQQVHFLSSARWSELTPTPLTITFTSSHQLCESIKQSVSARRFGLWTRTSSKRQLAS